VRIRLRLYLAAVTSTVALALLSSLAGAPTAQAATSCDTTGKTVGHSAAVRIYRFARRPRRPPSLGWLPRYFACMRKRHTPAWPLPVDDTDPQSDAQTTLMSFRIAGSFVGYVVQDSYPMDLYQTVYSVNAATGRARRYLINDTFFVVTGLAVNRSGSVAYIDKDTCPHCRYDTYAPGTQPATFHVYRGAAGARFVLDSGEDIDPASLTIVGSEVHWLRGGQPRSAPF
jgi:hypothetical protein